MTDRPEPPTPRLSRRAVLAAPAGLATPAAPGGSDAECVTVCRAWLANKAETLQLLDRWAAIEARLIEAHRRSGADNPVLRSQDAPPLRAIDARLDALSAERHALAPRLADLQATTRDAVLLKFEVVRAELFVQDFPVIYGLLHTAVRELEALW